MTDHRLVFHRPSARCPLVWSNTYGRCPGHPKLLRPRYADALTWIDAQHDLTDAEEYRLLKLLEALWGVDSFETAMALTRLRWERLERYLAAAASTYYSPPAQLRVDSSEPHAPLH
jgi:hypothetical protein